MQNTKELREKTLWKLIHEYTIRMLTWYESLHGHDNSNRPAASKKKSLTKLLPLYLFLLLAVFPLSPSLYCLLVVHDVYLLKMLDRLRAATAAVAAVDDDQFQIGTWGTWTHTQRERKTHKKSRKSIKFWGYVQLAQKKIILDSCCCCWCFDMEVARTHFFRHVLSGYVLWWWPAAVCKKLKLRSGPLIKVCIQRDTLAYIEHDAVATTCLLPPLDSMNTRRLTMWSTHKILKRSLNV